VEFLVAIILPMYNEELSIPLLKSMFFPKNFNLQGYDYRIIVVNDGSADNTLSLVNQWAIEDSKVKVVTHEHNQGVGQAILTGFREAVRLGCTCIVTMDADATHPGQVIHNMVQEIDNGADIVIASRFAPGGSQIGVPPLRKLYSWGARLVMTTVFHLQGVKDYTIGFRAYKASLIKTALEMSHGNILRFKSFATSVEILLKLAPFATRIVELPIILRYDNKQSTSKLKLWLTIRDYILLCLLPKHKCTLGRGLKI